MDTDRVIRYPGDEDEGVRWACRAQQQRGPVEIALGPAPAVLRLGRTWLSVSFGGGTALFLPWLARQSVCLKSVRPRISVLTAMPRPALGESCTTSIKDFAIFPPHQRKKKKKKILE